jgi:hypothetical protein
MAFERAIHDGEAIMLALVLRPGLDNEGLEIFSRRFRIVKDTPSCCPITPPNSLVGANRVQKLRRSIEINLVFDGHEDGALVRRWFSKQERLSPMVPDIEGRTGVDPMSGLGWDIFVDDRMLLKSRLTSCVRRHNSL